MLGARVEQALAAAGQVIPIRLRDHPHADDATVGRIRAATADADALIAVGSGTINDLCKYAAFQDGKPYAVFGTAPSMNGYTSVNAAITVGGPKKSLRGARAGRRVPRSRRAGGRAAAHDPQPASATACAGRPPRPTGCSRICCSISPIARRPSPCWPATKARCSQSAAALMAGDLEAMGGWRARSCCPASACAISGGSHPASQGEHLISHYIEMMGRPTCPRAFTASRSA